MSSQIPNVAENHLPGVPEFVDADAEFVRVLEDLIDTLIAKNVLRLTDLPAAAQAKLIERKGLRSRVHDALNPLSPDSDLC